MLWPLRQTEPDHCQASPALVVRQACRVFQVHRAAQASLAHRVGQVAVDGLRTKPVHTFAPNQHDAMGSEGEPGRAPRPKTPREIGQELEAEVEAFLRPLGLAYEHPHRFRSKRFGLWDIDFYVKTSPAVLISCKNPTKRASIIRSQLEGRLQHQSLASLLERPGRSAPADQGWPAGRRSECWHERRGLSLPGLLGRPRIGLQGDAMSGGKPFSLF